MPKLTIEESGRSLVYEILDDMVLVGRREGVAVRLTDPHVGSEHCQIRMVPGVGWKLIDLESRNGTKVNGAFVNQHVLGEGDVIQVGHARILFSGAGAPLPAPPSPVAPAPGPAPVAPGFPSPVTPRPLPREDREPRVRRSRRGNKDTPVIVAAVVVGSLLLLVVFLWLGSAWFRMSDNMTIYFDMLDLMQDRKYEEAHARGLQADPAGDQEGWLKVKGEMANLQELMNSRDAIATGNEAFGEFSKIESWIQNNRADVAGAVRRWEAFAARWEGTYWASQARQRVRDLLGTGGTPGPGPGTPEKNPIDRDWQLTVATANHLRGKDRFQDAIDATWKFWNENQLKTGAKFETWKARVESTVREIEDAADKRWYELSDRAKRLARDGDVEAAISILKDVAQEFGIEKYQNLATELLRKIQRDG